MIKHLDRAEKLIMLVVIVAYFGLLLISQNWIVALVTLILPILQIVVLLRLVRKRRALLKTVEEIDAGTFNAEVERKTMVLEHIFSMHNKLQEVLQFTQNLGKDDFQFKYLDSEDGIGEKLTKLQTTYKEQLHAEKIRTWHAEGIARVNEILRASDNLNQAAEKVLSYIINYVDANQGGFYLKQEETNSSYLELIAAYAYNRKKYTEKKIAEGDGILGQVMLEKDVVYLKEVPTDYVNITSGLGEATPTNIIIIPFIFNDTFYGAMELAAFETISKPQIEFLTKAAEAISSTVSMFIINEHTSKLLEESQAKTVELQSREEEMRQNMEELKATQEEMERNKIEMDGLFSAINNSQGLVEFNTEGEILKANEQMENITGLSIDLLRQSASIVLPGNLRELYNLLQKGENYECEIKIHTNDSDVIWLNANYSPVFDEHFKLKKVLALFLNITKRKEKEVEFERLSLVADNTTNSVIITDADGHVEYVNPGFTRLSKYSLEEMIGRKPGDILQGKNTDQQTVKRIRDKINSKESLFEEILNYDKEGNSYWISLAINPVKNDEGEVIKYISVQANITETKIQALDYKNKLEAIDRSNAIIEFDIDGTITDVNSNFLEIVNYSKEELIGQHHQIFVPEEDINAEYDQLWDDLRAGQFISREFRRLDKNGNEIWLRGIYNPLFDIDGNPSRVVKYATEITNEKELFIETEKQRKELSSHIETLNKTIATLEFDHDGKIIDANNVYLDVSGYTLQDLLGEDYNVLISEKEREKPQNIMMWQSLKEGNYFTGQFQQIDATGKNIWLLGTFNPVLNDDGKLERIKMFAQFNTLHKENEIKNAEIIDIFNKILPVVELDVDGICKKANQNFYTEFSFSRLQLRDKKIVELFERDFNDKQFKQVLKKLHKTQIVEETVSYVSDQGEIRIYRALFNPIRRGKNEINRILVVLVDKERIVNFSTS